MAVPPNFPIFASLPAGQNPLSLFDQAFAMILNGQAPVPVAEIDVGVTTVVGGGGNILYDNGGKLGALASTGNGLAVRQTAPSIINANLNTPSAINLTNATHLPLAAIDGLAAGIATWLAAPSSANLLAAMTSGTGTGLLVFNNTPTFITPILGVASATSLATSGDVNVGGNEAITGALTIGTPLGVAYGGTGASIGAFAGNLNLSVSATVNANALTVTVNGANGAALSATNPFYAQFRNVALTSGVPTELTVTASPTLTLTNGSTMGVSGNNVPFRLWLVGLNDAGTYRLGLVNTVSGDEIMYLRPGIVNATAEGGAGGADLAQTIYSNAAVAAKAMNIIGWMEWSAGLAAIGAWATAPTTVKVWQPGDPLPGDYIQVRRVNFSSTVMFTAQIPFDNTKPQNTEGTQIMSKAITCSSAANFVEVEAQSFGAGATGSTNYEILALFQDANVNALAAGAIYQANPISVELKLHYRQIIGTTAASTFNIRIGVTAGSTSNATNADSGNNPVFNGVSNSFLMIKEQMV